MTHASIGILPMLVLHATLAGAAECVVGGACVGGICVGGTPTSCPVDGDPCVRITCDPVRGCGRMPLTGPSCDDGDACTRGDRCAAGRCVGQPLRCADTFDCTEDVCEDGTCQHHPVDARCDGDVCSVAACRPVDPGADRRGCVAVPTPDGTPCTDDGLGCTDEVCEAGTCLHLPIDTRCGPPGQCTTARCAPEGGEHDAAGCVAGTLEGDGSDCAEDGDPCSVDRCGSGRCGHEPVDEVATCAPIRRAFQKARGLAALGRGLHAELESAPVGGEPRRRRLLLERLGRVEAGLEAVAERLAGRGGEPDQPSITRPGALGETRAQRRARSAAAAFGRTPRHARALVAMLRGEADGTFSRRALALARGVRALRAELARVQAIRGTFVRAGRIG